MAHTPSSRRPRGLGIHCMPDTATAMIPTRKAVLQSLLTTLLRRFLTPRHQKMNIPHDDWFRAVVLPIVADSDGHVLATVCAMAFSIATGKLDLSIQGLFGAGKSRAAAILIAGLLALDPERRLRYQLICKENTGTKSFIEVLIYLQLPAEVFKRVGRLISDGEANKPFFFCERLSASMARSLRLELYLYTAVDSRPGPGGSRTTASCQS